MNANRFSKFSHWLVPKKTLYLPAHHIHYIAKLRCEILGRYSDYFTCQQKRAPAHEAWETVNAKANDARLYSVLSVAAQQSGNFCHGYIDSFLQNLSVKNFGNRSAFTQIDDK